MTRQLTLRLREDDLCAFDAAAENIAGPAGAPYVGRTLVLRRALAVFIAGGGGGASEGLARAVVR